MILYAGDLHGLFDSFENRIRKCNADYVVQVGDLGFYKDVRPIKTEVPIFFCRGNHEDHITLLQYKEVTEVWPNTYFVPDGTVVNIDGKSHLFIGGASSIDKEYNFLWQKEETVTYREAMSIIGSLPKKVDVIVSHTCPKSIFKKILPLLPFQGLKDEDITRSLLEDVLNLVEFDKWFFGHFHLDWKEGNLQCLDAHRSVIG